MNKREIQDKALILIGIMFILSMLILLVLITIGLD